MRDAGRTKRRATEKSGDFKLTHYQIKLRVNYFTVDYQGEVESSVVIYSQKRDVKSIGSGISCETVGILGNKASIRVTWPEDFWCMYRDVIEVMPWGRSSPSA